jgi:hypothetical protein
MYPSISFILNQLHTTASGSGCPSSRISSIHNYVKKEDYLSLLNQYNKAITDNHQ